MRLSWDKRYLYLLAEVKDDSFVMNQVPDPCSPWCSWYAADCVEVFIDASNKAAYDRSYSNLDRYHLELVAGTSEGREAKWRCANRGPDRPRLKDVKIASTFQEDGYTIEMAIPFANFPALKPIPGCIIRFAVNVNDRDNPAWKLWQRKQTMFWRGLFGASKSSLNYTSLVLID